MAPTRHRRRSTGRAQLCRALAVLVVAFVGLLSAASPAMATDTVSTVEVLSAQGDELFKAGEYHEALRRYQKAHSMFNDVRLVWNIARCHEKLGEAFAARTLYQRVAQTADDPAWRWDAQRKVSRLSRQLRSPAPEPVRMVRRGRQPGPSVIDPGPQVTGAATAGQWTLIGGGIAAGILGGVFYALEDSASSDLESSELTSLDRQFREKDQSNFQSATIASFTVSGAFLVSGIVWMIVDASSDSDTSAGFVPTADGGTMMFSTSF